MGRRTSPPSQCHSGLRARRKGRAASAGDSVTCCVQGKELGGGRDHALWLHSLFPPRPLLSQEAGEGQRGQ